MAVKVITGTKQQGELTMGPRTTAEDATPGTPVAMECMFRTINLRFTRDTLPPIITLCTEADDFAQLDVGAATGSFALNGYMSTGSVYSDPLSLITEQYAGQFIATFGSGNTVTWDGKVTSDDNTFEARNNSARQVTGVIVTTPTSTWTTT